LAFSAGIDDVRMMALRYEALAQIPNAELAGIGLERRDIPRAVLAASARG